MKTLLYVGCAIVLALAALSTAIAGEPIFHVDGHIDGANIGVFWHGSFSGGGGAACPQGSAYADGCAGASQSATFQQSNFFTYAAQSGQTLSSRPPWNVAGVDYPVGATTAVGSLTNPAAGGLPSGCTYYANGYNDMISTVQTAFRAEYTLNTQNANTISGNPTPDYINPVVYCQNPSFAGNLSGFNFGPIGLGDNSSTANHSCIFVMISRGVHGNINITNNNFENDTYCSLGPNVINQFALLRFGNSNNASLNTITVMNNTALGHYNDACCITPSALTIANNKGAQYFAGDGTEFLVVNITACVCTIEYNSTKNFPNHHYTINFASSAIAQGSTWVHKYNYMEGWHSYCATGHGEVIFSDGGTSTFPVGARNFEYNTVLQPTGSGNCSATTFYPMGGSSTDYMTSVTINANTMVLGNYAGGQSTYSTTFSYVVDDGNGTYTPNRAACTGAGCTYATDSVPGRVLTITSAPSSGAPGVGALDSAHNFQIDGIVAGAGTGVGSQWTIECANSYSTYCPASVSVASATATASGSGGVNGTAVYTVSGGSCTTQPTINVTWTAGVLAVNSVANAGSCSTPPGIANASLAYASGTASGWTGATATLTIVNAYQYNFFPSFTFTGTNVAWSAYNSVYQGTSSNAGTLSGNPSLTLTNNYMNISGGPVGAWAARAVTCTNAATTFGGNVDMTGGGAYVNSYQLNNGSSTNTSTGC